MKPTFRVFQALDRRTARARTTAFIGLGRMGSEMAYNLFSKTLTERPDSSFVVCDAVPESAVSFCRHLRSQCSGAPVDVAQTPEEWVSKALYTFRSGSCYRLHRAARAAETIVTMLPSSPEVKIVYTESNGIMSALRSFTGNEREQTLLIDSTTLDVDVSRRVSSDVAHLGAQMVDAPVSGG